MRALTIVLTVSLFAAITAYAANDPADELLGSSQLWQSNRRDDLSRLALQKLLSAQPNNTQALYQLALLELRANHPDIAQRYLERLRGIDPSSPFVREVADQIRLNTTDREAFVKMQLMVRGGRCDDVKIALAKLYPNGAPNADALYECYRVMGATSNGRATARAGLAELLKKYPNDTRYRDAYRGFGGGDATGVARIGNQNRTRSYGLSRDEKFWNAMRDSGNALDRQDFAAANKSLDAALRLIPNDARALARRNDIKLAQLRAEAEQAVQAQQTGTAVRKYEEAIAMAPRDAWLRYALAKLYQQLQMPDLAQTVMDEGLGASNDDDMAYAAALVYSSNDDRAKARAALARIDAQRMTTGMRELFERLNNSEKSERAQFALDQARQFAAREQRADALQQLNIAHEAQPQDDSIATQSGWIAASVRDYRTAANYFQAAQQQQIARGESDGSAQRGLNYLDNLRDGYIAVGAEFSSKSGDSGISTLNRRIIPVDIRVPLDYDEHIFMRADYLDLSSGSLHLDNFSQAADFGKVLAYTPPFASGSIDQSASGAMLGVGYETGPWRVDIGHMPSTFPVSYWVGGVRYANYDSDRSLTVDVSRRPVTGSLIAFAGAKDPITGSIWGGVRSTGIDAKASHQIRWFTQTFDAYTGAGWHKLDGDNVLSNDEMRLRGGIDWNAIARADQTVNIGVAVNYWRYAENERYYTFGHGGYYSPQSYVSFGVPIEWNGRHNRLTWTLRGSVSQSFSSEKTMPYYPTDSALQRQAENTANANDLTTPVHDGGSGSGSSYALRGAMEYHVDSQWAVGAKFDIERSDFYAPNTFALYLRYRLTPRRGDYELPRPPVPYAYY